MISLKVLKDVYSVCRFNSNSEIPSAIYDSDFYSITKTEDEISVICKQLDYTNNILQINKDWRILKILGPLNFSLIGIIAKASKILYENMIPIFTISTYETDYILVKSDKLDKAIDSLSSDGYEISNEV